jgi:hypothetical protein
MIYLMYCNISIWQCCYRDCLKLSTEQEQTIRSAVINPMKLQIDEVGQLVKCGIIDTIIKTRSLLLVVISSARPTVKDH